jgi:MerR family transcriptional regulator, light-induced transcriptional regulator
MPADEPPRTGPVVRRESGPRSRRVADAVPPCAAPRRADDPPPRARCARPEAGAPPLSRRRSGRSEFCVVEGVTQLEEPLLSIGDLARATGLTVETIRMWERRYGRPHADRLASGHRRYSQAEARRLRLVADAVAHGIRPSEAVAADDAKLDALLATFQPVDPPDLDAWFALARAFDARGARERLRAAAAQRSAKDFVTDLLGPLLAAIGRAWADGRMDVRHEHFFSAVVTETLRELAAEAAAKAPGGPVVLLTTLPGERHALGLEMAALVAASAGARAVLLGPDMPIDDVAAAARELDAHMVALSVSVAHGGIDADRELALLRQLLPSTVRLVAGGAGAARRRRSASSGIERVEDFGRFEQLVRGLREPAP